MNNKKFVLFVLIAFIISFIFMIQAKGNSRYYEATNAYRVYLNGKSLGLIASEKELEKYINREQKDLKEEFNVEQVYTPKGLEIKEETTYSNKLMTTEKIYNEIKDNASFTIKGYEITITKQEIQEIGNDNNSENDERYREKTTIYVLDIDMFKNAVSEVVKSFVDEEQYKKFLENNQEEIVTTGKIIENVYIEDDFIIKNTLIPTDKVIFTDENKLTAYLLFGTTDKQSTYTVKAGDSISKIAEDNEISVNEFLIANPEITDEKALLYAGQKVVIGLINPKFVIIEEEHIVENEEILYQTESRYNNSLYVGVIKVIREGIPGEAIVTKKVKYLNGEISDVVTISTEVIKESTSRIIEKGGKTVYKVGNVGIWKWPTKIPYTISSIQGWRRGKWHKGIDICGTGGIGSPIYAANTGTVSKTGYNGAYGLRIVIDHNNGFKTLYAHLSKVYVSPGQGVEMGQLIALMGNTGVSTGPHLHFEVHYKNNIINPFDVYQ